MQKADPSGTSGFVGFLEKVKNERGSFGLSLPWRDSALSGFRIVSKKWTDQCEDCSLKNPAIVGHFSLKGKAPTKNTVGKHSVERNQVKSSFKSEDMVNALFCQLNF